ncbi:MAG: hypothetical protein AB8G16_19900 [Gammaproteobacteria bacterium]
MKHIVYQLGQSTVARRPRHSYANVTGEGSARSLDNHPIAALCAFDRLDTDPTIWGPMT